MFFKFKFKAPKTIFNCIVLLSTVQFWLCCSSIWNYKGRLIANKWTRLYSIFFAVIVLFGLATSLAIIWSDPVQRARFVNLDRLVLSIAVIEIIMSCTCMFSITVISMQWQAKRHVQLYRRLHALDNQLMREFDAKLNYFKLMRKNIIVLSVAMAAYVCAICSALVQLVHKNMSAWLLGAWCYIIVTGGPHLSGYVHMNLAEILRIRFRLMQRILTEKYFKQKFPSTELRLQRLQRAVEIVKELHMLIIEINAIYSTSLISAMAHDFTLTTSEFYFIFGRSIGGHTSYRTLFYVTLCMLLPLYKMIVGPIYCEQTIKEGKKCLRIIERIDSWLPHNEFIRNLVSSILFWRMDNKIEFDFGLNIKLNKTLISTITFVIFNYLLILIQFRMMEEMGAQIEEQKSVIKDWIGLDEFNQTASTDGILF